MFQRQAGRAGRHGHPADRIHGLGRRTRPARGGARPSGGARSGGARSGGARSGGIRAARQRPGSTQLDKLGEHGDRDFPVRRAAEVKAGRHPDPVELPPGHAPVGEVSEH